MDYSFNMEDELNIMKAQLLKKAIEAGWITMEEYKKEYHLKYLSEYDTDSFFDYLACLFAQPPKKLKLDPIVFMTNNEKMLKDKAKFENKFKVKIMTMDEMLKEIKKGDAITW